MHFKVHSVIFGLCETWSFFCHDKFILQMKVTNNIEFMLLIGWSCDLNMAAPMMQPAKNCLNNGKMTKCTF